MFNWFKKKCNTEISNRTDGVFNEKDEQLIMYGFPIERKEYGYNKATHYKKLEGKSGVLLIKDIDSIDFDLGMSEFIYIKYLSNKGEWIRIAVLGHEKESMTAINS